MPADIGLVDNQFGIAVTLYYATFIPAEPCMAILLKTVGVHNLLAFCGGAWGVTTLCMGFIQNATGLYTCRLLIGLFEAGVAPCYDIYVSSIYKKNERVKRIAVIFGFASLANALGGLMATFLLLLL
jgi:MFS family permease